MAPTWTVPGLFTACVTSYVFYLLIAFVQIKEYEASEIINSANKCLESQVRDLKKELRAKEMQSEALKEHTQNIFLLREEKASLEQTIKGMKVRGSE